nr:uncharacterized protein LOC111413653 [Onthophagus taurus]
MVIGIGLPVDVPHHSVTWGVVFRSYYLLPTNASQFTNPLAYNDVSRKKRTPTRWDLYSALEYFSESSGLGNGRACLLRSICEISSTPLETRNGLLSEILHLLLTPSSTEEIPISHSDHEYWAAEKLGKETENCAILFPECSGSLVARFTRLAKGFM